MEEKKSFPELPSIRRLTLFAGHYGSGKTNIALNYALWLKKHAPSLSGEGTAAPSVTVADLDIVNPYFRTQDSAEWLEKAGIRLIVSQYAGTNLDAPAMPKETYGLLADRTTYGVLDIGGDDRGALALGRYTDEILEEGNYEMLLVANQARPLTRSAQATLEVAAEIEGACHLPFTGIVNNTNLGPETSPEEVMASIAYAKELSRLSGLPIRMTCVRRDLYDELKESIPNLFPLDLQKLYYMLND